MKTITIIFCNSLLFIFTFSCNVRSDNNIRYGYYKGRELKFIKRYKENLLEGQSQWFYIDGTIEQTVIFKGGKESGNAYYFFVDGTLRSFRNWREGKMIGYATDYYDDTLGIIKSILLFNNEGSLIYRKYFDKTGHFLTEEGQRPEPHK